MAGRTTTTARSMRASVTVMRSPSMRTSTRDPPREEVAAARNTSATMERDLEEEEEEEVEEIMSGST